MNRSVWLVTLVLLPGMVLAAEPAGKPQRKNSFNENFNRVDTNRDGKLSISEAKRNAPGVARRFTLMDANHDGQVSKQELINYGKEQRRRAVTRFKRADRNHNGKLSKQEARTLPGIHARFDQIDANHDGQLTLREIGRYAQSRADKRRQAAGKKPD
jgi:Ca2+-binding EF-hand superfamily protein